MLKRYDELELLDLIEDELDPQAASALRQRLEADPEVKQLVEQFCRDRAALRAIQDPPLPQDFLSQIEPLLARPMLMAPVASEEVALKPGSFRRQHRRRVRRIRWGRLALVASLMLAMLAGVWVGVDRGLQWARLAWNERVAQPDESLLAASTPEPAMSLDGSLLVSVDRGVVHHHHPLQVQSGALMWQSADAAGAAGANRNATSSRAASAARSDDSKQFLAADFAIVIDGSDLASVEKHMQMFLAGAGNRAALVRNFSYEQARQLEQEWRIAQGKRETGADLVTAASGSGGSEPGSLLQPSSDLKLLAQRVREHMRLRRPAASLVTRDESASEASSAGRPVVGAADMAPSLEQQLEYSSRGATHTLSVPASQLAQMIEQLSLVANYRTTLQMLPEHGAEAADEAEKTNRSRHAAESWHPLKIWIDQGPAVKRSLQRLTQAKDDAVVLVPVIVREAEQTKRSSAPR